ncbi:MAG: HAD family phosphatase [Bryobacteraceae bacterium]|nr:HAD family phosphatase [Bryobacteraceae bacterium]
MIRTLIFDLGRVIVPFDFRRGYEAMSARCGLPPEEVRARLASDGLVRAFESGGMGARDFHRRVQQLLETGVEFEEFREIWFSIFLPETLISDDFLEKLHTNYRLVLLSNTNPLHFEMIRERYPALRHFDAFVLSYEAGAMKPDAPIYEAAVRAARCAPGECFFTDDIPEYVEAARRFGIDAVVFEGQASLERELARRGVRWDQ